MPRLRPEQSDGEHHEELQKLPFGEADEAIVCVELASVIFLPLREEKNVKVEDGIEDGPGRGPVLHARGIEYADHIGDEGVATVVKKLSKGRGGLSPTGLFAVDSIKCLVKKMP